jgi:hypothetical protein
MQRYQTSYDLEVNELHIASESRCYRSIGNEENLRDYIRHDTLNDFD